MQLPPQAHQQLFYTRCADLIPGMKDSEGTTEGVGKQPQGERLRHFQLHKLGCYIKNMDQLFSLVSKDRAIINWGTVSPAHRNSGKLPVIATTVRTPGRAAKSDDRLTLPKCGLEVGTRSAYFCTQFGMFRNVPPIFGHFWTLIL